MSKEFYIGLDLSLTASGVVVLNSEGKIVDMGLAGSENMGDSVRSRFARCLANCNGIRNIIEKYMEGAKAIAIEGYSFMSKGNISQLVENGTLVRAMLLGFMEGRDEKKHDIIEVAPISLKKFLLGKVEKNAKNIMCREVFIKFKEKLDDDNLVDAFLLGHVARCFFFRKNYGFKNQYKQYQWEMADKMIKKQIEDDKKFNIKE